MSFSSSGEITETPPNRQIVGSVLSWWKDQNAPNYSPFVNAISPAEWPKYPQLQPLGSDMVGVGTPRNCIGRYVPSLFLHHSISPSSYYLRTAALGLFFLHSSTSRRTCRSSVSLSMIAMAKWMEIMTIKWNSKKYTKTMGNTREVHIVNKNKG